MKRILLTLLLLVLTFVLTGCQSSDSGSSPAEQEKSIVVGFSQLGSESSWRIANTASMEAAAKEAGISLMVDNGNQKQEKQIAAIRSFIAYQVDVIAFSPIIETGWDNVLNEAKSANIPVILMDRMIRTDDDSLYTAYLGANFYMEGRRAGEYLIQKADAIGAEHLNIAEISGTLDSTPTRERQQGFLDAIAGDDRFTIIDSISGDFLRSKGRETMSYLLNAYGAENIQVVYSHNDAMTLGALDILSSTDIVPGKDMLFITVDGEEEAVQALRDGKINCIAECTPLLGEAVMALVLQIKNNEPYAKISYPEESVMSDLDDDERRQHWEGF